MGRMELRDIQTMKAGVGLRNENWKPAYYKSMFLHSFIIVYGVLVLVM
jgi:hypothetical protein